MRILIYKWRAYNYRDVHQAFVQLGHKVDIIEQDLVSYDCDLEFEKKLAGILDAKRKTCEPYDFVFTMNYFGTISNVCQKHEIPYLCWTCDNPLISMYHKSVYNECNYIFSFDQSNYLEFRGMGVEHIWYLPLAVDTKRIEYVISQEQNPEKYRNEIAFVGSLYERNTYDKLSYHLPDYLRGYFEAVIQAQLSISGGNIIESMLTADVLAQLEEYFHLDKTEDSFSDLGLIFSTTVMGFKVAAVQRRQLLLALAKKYDVSIYSNSNTGDLLGVNHRGGVDYWSEMPLVFRETKINLNMTIPNIKSGLPLRVWDILGSGGFLMTNYQAELPMYFEEGKDYACFEDERELVEKCGYYLEHDDVRCEIAYNGFQKVREYHSYRKRIEEMIEIVFGKLKCQCTDF